MRFAFSSLVALFAATSAVAQPFVKRTIQINPDRSVIRPEFAAEVGGSAPAPTPATNAKRFAAGLPPLPPRAHRRRPHNVGTKVDSAPRAVSSSTPPVNVRCNLLVKKADDESSYGYLQSQWNDYGEYGLFQSDPAGALEVAFSYVPDDQSSLSGLDFTAVNGPSGKYPYVGLANGYDGVDDIAPGDYSYGYLAGTIQTAKDSTPVMADDSNSFSAASGSPESVESAVWTYDPNSNAITAQWVNTDGSKPTTYLAYSPADNAIVYGGDIGALAAAANAELHTVTLTCVPPPSTAPLK